MKKMTTTLYSKNNTTQVATGVEICEYTKMSEGSPVEGQVCLRFFVSNNSQDQIKFVCLPWEAFDLYVKINKVARSVDPIKEKSEVHKWQGKAEGKPVEMVTSVQIEKWISKDKSKSGYAITCSRSMGGKANSYNVPIGGINKLLFVGEFLRSLSVRQSWEIMAG